jgi:methionyl-tRNA formyltransferase
MRIIFMGTPEFALPSLELLLRNDFPVAAVVTAPDKPTGRGLQVTSSPVKCFALDRGIDVLQPVTLRDQSFLSKLRSYQPELFIVVAFRILPPEVYTLPVFGTFNLHASLLPKYRGAAPINWAIINGERETGVTTFFLEEKVDTGKIILQARLKIDENETAGELHDRLATVGAELVLLTTRLIGEGKAVPKDQDNSATVPAPKIFKEHCEIDWNKRADEIHNLVRGLSPRPCAFTFHNAVQLKIYRTRFTPDESSGTPGKILRADSSLIVQAGSGTVEILEIQQAGRKRMGAEEFLRGLKISIGQIFH